MSSESKKHIYSELTRFKALLRALPGPLCRDLISLNLTFFFLKIFEYILRIFNVLSLEPSSQNITSFGNFFCFTAFLVFVLYIFRNYMWDKPQKY